MFKPDVKNYNKMVKISEYCYLYERLDVSIY